MLLLVLSTKNAVPNQDFDYRTVIVMSDASERSPRCVPKGCCVFGVEPGGVEADVEAMPEMMLVN